MPSHFITLTLVATLCGCLSPAVAVEVAGDATAAAATTQSFPNSDITGNDVDCGQAVGTPCAVCGPLNTVIQGCTANFKCRAVVYNGTCGFLKSAGDATVRVSKPGSMVIVFTDANETATVVAAEGGATSGSPAPGAEELPGQMLAVMPAAASGAAVAGNPGMAPIGGSGS